MEHERCDLCGSDDGEMVYGGANWQTLAPDDIVLVRCRNCGLMYLDPQPTAEELEGFYGADYMPFRPAVGDERFRLMAWMRRRKLVRRRQVIERYAQRSTGALLDVGCATGLFLHEMAHSGWRVAGVEPAMMAAEYARVRFGLDVFVGPLAQSSYAASSFDAVTFWDVLEHTAHPSTELGLAARLLRPGGLLVLSVPNWRSVDRWVFGPTWIGYDPPRHLYVFTRSTLTSLLCRAGFEVITWVCMMPAYFPFAISLERWMRVRSPALGTRAAQVMGIPGVRFVFEPWFSLMNFLGFSSVVTVVARKDGRIPSAAS